MTPEDRRQVLIAAGFACASTSFATPDGPRWFAQEPAIDPAMKREKFGPHNLFIDLTTGRWYRWRRNVWKRFEQGPWNELVEDNSETEEHSEREIGNDRGIPSPAPSVLSSATERPYIIAPLVAPDGRPVRRLFSDACLQFYVDLVEQAGFRITEPSPRLLDGYIDLGIRSAERDGISYVIICQTNKKSIIGPGAKTYQLSDFLAPQSAAKSVVKPLPRRELSAVGIVVQGSGRSLQKGLF